MLGKEKETIYLVLFSLSMCVFALCVCLGVPRFLAIKMYTHFNCIYINGFMFCVCFFLLESKQKRKREKGTAISMFCGYF